LPARGQALKLGFKISQMGVAKILRRQRIPPAPRREYGVAELFELACKTVFPGC